jgi:voltage-gated potassium channel Kch
MVTRPLITVLCILVTVYLCATILIMIFEEEGFGVASTRIVPAFLGELGRVDSGSLTTQISVFAALLASVGFLAVITARITTGFVEFCRRGGSIVKKVDSSDHIIICGWNFQGHKIVDELLRSEAKPYRDVVLLADCAQRPVQDERIEFIRGDPTQDKDLISAGVKRADSVIVLSDLTKNANEADAAALMIVLAVESINRQVHTSVQIVNSVNRVHLERAHADEIVCLDQMGGNLVVASALNHGVSSVVSELLTFSSGSEYYRYDKPISDRLVGKDFHEALQLLAEEKVILLALETDDSPELREMMPGDVVHSVEGGKRVIIVNPQGPCKISQGDALFVIAESEPDKF